MPKSATLPAPTRTTVQTAIRSGVDANNSSMSKRGKKKGNKPFQFSRYIFRVLNQIHPSLSLTKKAMKVMDDFMLDVYSRLVSEAAGLIKVTGKATLTSAEFQTATKLLLPGELAKHAVSEATKAVAHFMQSKSEDNTRRKGSLTASTTTIEVEVHPSTSVEDSPAPTDDEEATRDEAEAEEEDHIPEKENPIEKDHPAPTKENTSGSPKGGSDQSDKREEMQVEKDKESQAPSTEAPLSVEKDKEALVEKEKVVEKDAEDELPPSKRPRLEEEELAAEKPADTKAEPDSATGPKTPAKEPSATVLEAPEGSQPIETDLNGSSILTEDSSANQSALEASPEKEEPSSADAGPCTVMTVKYTRVTSTTTTKTYSTLPCEDGEEIFSS